MAEDAELERGRLNRQLQSKNNELQSCRQTNDALDGQIARLRTAYQKVSGVKSQYLTIKSDERKDLLNTDSWKWKGAKYSEYKNNKCPRVSYGIDEYYRDIDKILDAINMKIAELENKKFSDDFIGGLIKTINSIRYQIQNLFN